jgi:hypothetical protein
LSEFLAEASVLITPDTSKFRATLIAELRKATQGVAVPIPVVAAPAGARQVTQANKAAAASATQAATATKELTATRTSQIIADREAAAEEANLAAAQRLTAAAQQRVIAVEEAGSRSTSALAAARAELRAANVALTASQRAVDAAMLQGAEAAQAEAVESLRAAVALRAQAVAAEQLAASTVVGTRATAQAIRRNEQFKRGVEANSLELLKVRGATLAASSGFLAGAAVIAITAKAVEEANANIEAAARAERVFGEASAELEHHAEGLAQSFGLSTTEALKFEGQIGNILSVSKLTADEIPQLSENLVKLGADMAAFNNVGLDVVLKAISLGLVGNSRGLRQFGIELNAASVNAEALRETGKKNTDELTRGERVQARINLLFAQTINQQGAAARRSENLAQKTRTLRAEIQNLGDTVGKALIPQLVEVVSDASKVLHVFNELTGAAKGLANATEAKITGKGGGLFGGLLEFGKNFTGLGGLPGELKNLRTLVHVGSEEFFILKDAIIGAGDAGDTSMSKLHEAAVKAFDTKALVNFQSALKATIFGAQRLVTTLERARLTGLNNQIATLEDRLVGVKVAGGGAQAELAVLAQEETKARQALAAATAINLALGGRSQKALQDERDARLQLLDVLDRERDLRQKIADDAKQAADTINQIIADAQAKAAEAIQKADEATLASFAPQQGRIDLAQARAEGTKSLQDDLAVERQRQRFVEQQIRVISKSIIDENLKADKLRELRIARQQSINAQRADEEQIAQNRQQRRAQAFNRAAESIDLDISLAQTEKNRRGEIAARQRRIKLDQERMKAVRGDIIATKQLRNDIAEQRRAIAELRKELEKRNDAEKQLEFAFLQRQAGFAANLLSNLIPTAALAGTVGGTVASTNTPIPPANFAQSVHQRGKGGVAGGVGSAAQTHTAQRGASQSQMATLIHIQRGMLGVLTRLVGQGTHPEASHQRRQQATAYDTVYGV